MPTVTLPRFSLPIHAAQAFGACAVHCVPDCCGLDAFEFEESHVAAWLREQSPEVGLRARDELQQAIDSLVTAPEWIAFTDVNQNYSRVEAADWLEVMLGLLHATGVPKSDL
jgi:hypothetical protein